MGRRYVEVYCNGLLVRKFGGCGAEVKEMFCRYRDMAKEEFLSKHPKFEKACQNRFVINVYHSTPWRWRDTCDTCGYEHGYHTHRCLKCGAEMN